MVATNNQLWERFRRRRWADPDLGVAVDFSRVDAPLEQPGPELAAALAAMAELEAGALANRDESRMVGHYWLRAPELAPSAAAGHAIREAVDAVERFAGGVRAGAIRGAGGPFGDMLHIGIGGSAVGPQLVCDALGDDGGPTRVHFLDNADPDGVDRVLGRLAGRLDRTLVSTVSKSGWTPTPRQVLVEVQSAYARAGVPFERHAVATTTPDSDLDRHAAGAGWLARFPLWDWVGGRTSVTSAVGLLPAALAGADVRALLGGAAAMDRCTRTPDAAANPAALLALAWHSLGDGRGARNMVVLPYRDRLALLARHVQQLVMESVGKAHDRGGRLVRQGLTVYGHKGSSDQHSYFQQLRDGPDDFFVTFVHVRSDRAGQSVEVAPGLTLGDHLFGHLEATRDALWERGRQSITISLRDAGAASVGALIALFERAVGLYAELLDVNAYHQPAVDKAAAASVVALQRELMEHLERAGEPLSAEELAAAIGRPERTETVYKLLERLAEDPRRGVVPLPGAEPFGERYRLRVPAPAGAA